MNSVFNLPDGQVMFFEEIIRITESCEINNILLVKKLLGLVEMTSGLVNDSFSLRERQAVKMIFFAPCILSKFLGYQDLLLPRNTKFDLEC